jgi:streptomycin 6-kinase
MERCRQDLDATVMADQVVADGVAVHLFDMPRQVGDALLHGDIHHDGDIAEACVHVDQRDGG